VVGLLVCLGEEGDQFCLLSESTLTLDLFPHSLLNDASPMFPNLQSGPPDATGHS
jgi:hypothetical protein